MNTVSKILAGLVLLASASVPAFAATVGQAENNQAEVFERADAAALTAAMQEAPVVNRGMARDASAFATPAPLQNPALDSAYRFNAGE